MGQMLIYAGKSFNSQYFAYPGRNWPEKQGHKGSEEIPSD